MPIRGYSFRRTRFEEELMRSCPIKKTLARANPFTCPCPDPNYPGIPNGACVVCGGTGYQNFVDYFSAPASTLYFMFLDIQPGHGIYGVGGNFVKVMQDLGNLDTGDGIGFCKVQNFDYLGNAFAPRADSGLVRPDVVFGLDGVKWNVTKVLRVNVGDTDIALAMTLSEGNQVAHG